MMMNAKHAPKQRQERIERAVWHSLLDEMERERQEARPDPAAGRRIRPAASAVLHYLYPQSSPLPLRPLAPRGQLQLLEAP